MFLGDKLLVWLLLAFGAAMVAGSVAALVRPPASRGDDELERPPLSRSIGMIAVGAIAALWALASLVAG